MKRAYPLLLSTLIILTIALASWVILLPRSVAAKTTAPVPKVISTSFQPTAIPDNDSAITVESATFTSTATASVGIWSDQTALIGACCGGGVQSDANLSCKVTMDGNTLMSRDHTWYYTSDEGFDITGATTIRAGMHTFKLICSSTLAAVSSITLESGGTTIAYAG
jgi:hypothetical protein